jgi:SAM-dependent methyltransferase
MVQPGLDRPVFATPDALPPDVHAMLLRALDAMAGHPEIHRVRRAALDALRPAPGQCLLDAGCGLGEVARGLATDVGPTGQVVALDVSAATVAAAQARHDAGNVRYLVGDVAALNFPDATFDGVRSERVLQHVREPDAVIGELIRVTRPGGRVCLVDTDWDSLAFDGVPEDLVAAVIGHVNERVMRHDGRRMGRTLRGRLVRAGLLDLSVTAVSCVFGDPDSAAAVLPMANPRVPPEAGFFPADARQPWFAAVDDAGRRGDFLAVLTIWVVAGTRPA